MAKRRGNSEGSIFRLTDGRWCAFVSLGYRNGKRWRKKLTGETRGRVQDRLAEILNSVRQGGTVDTTRQRVGSYLKLWLQDVARNSVRPTTYASYTALVDRYLVPRLGRVELVNLTPQHVRRCLVDLLERGGVDKKCRKNAEGEESKPSPRALSPRTVQYCRAILRKALNQAVRDGLVVRNAAALTDPPKVQQHEIQPYAPEQARVFLKAVEGDRLEALFTVAVALGLRQGEILGLRWEDVDLTAGFLRVRYQLQRIDGEPSLVEPKTKRSRRTIKLPAVAVSALHAHRAHQAQERTLAGERWQEWGLVFSTTIGTPIEACNLNHRFQQITTVAQLPKIRFHDLRHTAATLLLAQGVHPRLVMETLGHSSISLTMNTYSHVIPVMKEEVAAKMDSILAERKSTLKATDDGNRQTVSEPVATSMATSATSTSVQ